MNIIHWLDQHCLKSVFCKAVYSYVCLVWQDGSKIMKMKLSFVSYCLAKLCYANALLMQIRKHSKKQTRAFVITSTRKHKGTRQSFKTIFFNKIVLIVQKEIYAVHKLRHLFFLPFQTPFSSCVIFWHTPPTPYQIT